jgi:hypothetical protein
MNRNPFSRGNGRETGDELRNGGKNPLPAHRLTMDMSRAETLACMLAQSRAASKVEVADLLAGMYMYEWDRLSKYWEDEEKVETYLQQICRISPQRWHHWMQFHHEQKTAQQKPQKWKWSAGKRKPAAHLSRLPYSAELLSVFTTAEAASPTSEVNGGRLIPVLTMECVLFAIASRTDSEIGHRLVAAGLKLGALEEEARNPRHAPR